MKHSEKPRRVVPFGKTPKTLLHQIRCAPLWQRKAVVAFVPFSTPKPWKIQPVLATVKIGEAAPIHRTVQPARPPVVTFALSSPTMVSEVPESATVWVKTNTPKPSLAKPILCVCATATNFVSAAQLAQLEVAVTCG